MNQNNLKKVSQILIVLFVTVSVFGCASIPKKEVATVERNPDGKVPRIPELKNAQVKAVWVPEKIEGSRWEEGHFLYVIDQPATWSVK